jgi:hypothetical protein
MSGPCSNDAQEQEQEHEQEQEQEQEQKITAAPLASAGNRSSARNNAITGEVWRHGAGQRHGGERDEDHGGDAQHVAGDVVGTTADATGILTDGFTL